MYTLIYHFYTRHFNLYKAFLDIFFIFNYFFVILLVNLIFYFFFILHIKIRYFRFYYIIFFCNSFLPIKSTFLIKKEIMLITHTYIRILV